VQFLGHLQLLDLVREYRRCGALELPSTSENWGLVVNEAVHAELPVLVSSHAGCVPELVEDGVSGLVLDPLSEESMARALHRFEAMSPQERGELSEAAASQAASQRPEVWANRVAEALCERLVDTPLRQE